jgi:hypothetical protein
VTPDRRVPYRVQRASTSAGCRDSGALCRSGDYAQLAKALILAGTGRLSAAVDLLREQRSQLAEVLRD